MGWNGFTHSGIFRYAIITPKIPVTLRSLLNSFSKVVFDGVMVILAIYTTNIIHPGVYLSSANPKFTMSMENLSGTGDA